MSYSFDGFSDHDFELFIAQLLGAELDRGFEVFARGPDRGVDLRHSPGTGSAPDIVQCKHYAHSSFATLKAAARREATTLSKMKPQPGSYRFVTSRSLTRLQKDQLVSILCRWVGEPGHVIGRDDLDLLIARHPKVERGNAKLWLLGGGQLDKIIHSGTYERSSALLEATRAELSRYVETNAFFRAREILRKERVLIVSGPPGIGKTTLARMLLVDASLDGYEPIEVSADIGEASDVFRSGERQAFHYDDFLGTTFLNDRLPKNEDQRLVQFLRRVVDSKSKLIVMTTREYILQQATQIYEHLARAGLEARRYLLSLSEYSRYDRARILYNHVWQSTGLSDDARRSLAPRSAYSRVIDHPNYNPRLIEHIVGLGSYELTEADNANFVEFALHSLSSPDVLWRHAFGRQLEEKERWIVLTVASIPPPIAPEDLEAAVIAYWRAKSIPMGGTAFQSSLKVLKETFVSSSLEDDHLFIRVVNPGLVDFVAKWLADAPGDALTMIEAATFFEQLPWLDQYVVQAAAPAHREQFASRLAASAIRLIDEKDPTWHKVRFSSEEESRWARRRPSSSERLVWVAGAIRSEPLYEKELGSWFAHRLEVERAGWRAGEVYDAAHPVNLLRSLGSKRITPELLAAAREWVWGAHQPDYAYHWEQGRRLRSLAPNSFSAEEWAAFQAAFTSWANARLADARFDEEVNVDEVVDAADACDVHLDEDLVAAARAAEDERRPSEPDNDDDYRERGTPQGASDEWGEMDAMFGRLDN